MRGGAILFSLFGFPTETVNGRKIPAPETKIVNGTDKLTFIDRTSDSFFNTFRRVKFSKSCSKCYYLEDRPYQLIYDNRNGNVYQYALYEFDRYRAVVQNSPMTDEVAAEMFISLPKKMSNSDFQFLGSGRTPPAYTQWGTKLASAIRDGNISIDQVLKFFYNNGNKNKGFKVDTDLQRFWNIFYREYQAEFF